ncbi:hypothetical protein P8452_50486 [Trifolium repens]|nr:hypothetical protein QL285_031024 [Trifolium repens]WJX65872.1 hypothetical protein P8452_50486 [Trifolium repens]
MRGRERQRGGSPRAHLGRSRRFAPSPAESREYDGDWTVVRRKGQKAQRQDVRGFDRQIQERRYRSGGRSSSRRNFYSSSRLFRYQSSECVHHHNSRFKSRCRTNAGSRDSCWPYLIDRDRKPIMYQDLGRCKHVEDSRTNRHG